MNNDKMQALTQAIANALPGWRYDSRNEYKHNGYLLGPNNARIAIGSDKGQNKLRAGGSFPDIHSRTYRLNSGRATDYDCVRNANYNSIGFSALKSPASIAKDLQNRLIPSYMALLHLAKKERLAYIEKSDELTNRVNLSKKITPALTDYYHYRRNRNEVHYQHIISGNINTAAGSVNAELNYFARSTDVNMKLSGLSDEQAIQILAILN